MRNVIVLDTSGGDDSDDTEVAGIPPRDYHIGDVINKTIGNASSTCECCGDVVDGNNFEEFIIGELDPVDFSDENHVLLCRDCYDTKDWEPIVKQNRLDQQIDSRLDEAIHWVTRRPVETLFLRRAAAGTALLLAATVLTTAMTAITSGLGPVWDLLGSTNFAIVGTLGLLGVAAGYWLHLHEREQNDHRGTTIREYNLSDGPWSVLVFASIGFVSGTGLLIFGQSSTLSILGLSTYVASAGIAFKNLESAIRADRSHPRVNWIPRYDRELYLLRMSIPVGVVFLIEASIIGALVPALAIGTYLFVRKWHDLGPNWKLFYYGGDSGGDN